MVAFPQLYGKLIAEILWTPCRKRVGPNGKLINDKTRQWGVLGKIVLECGGRYSMCGVFGFMIHLY